MDKPWACRLGWHKWIKRSTEDGQLYSQCRRCAKENSSSKLPPSAGIGL